MLLTICQRQHIHVAMGPAKTLSMPHKHSAPFPSTPFLRRKELSFVFPHGSKRCPTHVLRDKCDCMQALLSSDDFTADANPWNPVFQTAATVYSQHLPLTHRARSICMGSSASDQRDKTTSTPGIPAWLQLQNVWGQCGCWN